MSRLVLAHEDVGSGPAVVLLHSGVADRRMWQSLVPALARDHRVIAPDLRGFGDSPLSGGEYADVDDVVGLLDDLDVDDAVLVGASLGGGVALEVASVHPDRVSALVLLCPAYSGPTPTAAVVAFGEEEGRLLEAGDVDAAVELNVRTWLGPEASPDTRSLVTAMQRRAFDVQLAAEEMSPPPEPRRVEVDLHGIRVPTVVVTGGLDLDHFQAVGRLLAEQIPVAELVHLAWAGHLPALERPAEVQTLLLDRLAGR